MSEKLHLSKFLNLHEPVENIYIKPSLLKKKSIDKLIQQKDINNYSHKIIIENNNIQKKNIYFNIIIILLFVTCLLFLYFRYIEKKKNLNKKSENK